MSLYKSKDSPYWRYNFYVGNQRFSGSTGCTNKRKAKEHEAQRKVEASEELERAKKQASSPMTLVAAMDRYWNEKGKFLKRPDKILWSMAYLRDHLGADTLIEDIDDSMVAALVARRRQDRVVNVAAQTVTKVKRRIRPRKAHGALRPCAR